MAEERMLNDEILLGLIKANSGGGGTGNYNDLSNQPQIGGVTLVGNKSASDLGLADDDTVQGILDGQEIDSFSDVENALADTVKDVKVDGKSCLDTNRNAIVQITIPTEYEYTVSKVDNLNLKVTTKQNDVVTDETNYTLSGWSDPVDIDGHIQLNYSVSGGTWSVKTLVASTDYPAEQTWTWVYNQTPSVPVLTFEEAENHIGLSAAYADLKTNKQDTLTFDDVPTANSNNPVKSGGVKSAIDAAVSSAYHHAGTKTCVELVAGLLVAANEGNVYNMTDSGTTTADFIEGAGQPIKAGDNVGIAKISDGVYKFDLLSGFVDTTNFVQKSETAGLLKNDGTVDTTIQGNVSTLMSGLTNLDNEVNGDAVTYPYADVITIEDAVPANLSECSVKIEPVQSGSGDPSPENVRPITGHTEVSVTRSDRHDTYTALNTQVAGCNLIITEDGHVTIKGKTTSPFDKYISNGMVGDGVTSYKVINVPNLSSEWDYYIYDTTSSARIVTFKTSETSAFIIPSGHVAKFGLIALNASGLDIDLDMRPIIASENSIIRATLALGDTIYGGTVDFDSGVMTVTHAIANMSDLSWSAFSGSVDAFYAVVSGVKLFSVNSLCSSYKMVSSRLSETNDGEATFMAGNGNAIYVRNDSCADVTAFEATLSGATLCYELATPTTIQLTPQQIQLLQGTNTLYASTGDISVTVNGVSGAIGSVQEQANTTDAALAQLAADIAEQLPTAPTTDGAYVLTVTVADGTPTYSWESAS